MASINYNGTIFSSEQSVLKASNRAFRYGDGLFETIRMIKGKMPFFLDHIDRLSKSMLFLKMDPPENFSSTYIEEQILALAKENKIKDGARIRLNVFRKGNGYYEPDTNETEFLIDIEPLEGSEYVLNEKGYAIDVYYEAFKTKDKTAILKTNSSLVFVLAALYKKENNLDECIILNTSGRVAEAISSNIFAIINDQLVTPLLSESCLRGVMRQKIMSLSKEIGIYTHEGKLTPEDLLQADEVFLSNALNGIRWVEKFRDKTYVNNISQVILSKVNEELSKG